MDWEKIKLIVVMENVMTDYFFIRSIFSVL